MRKKRSRRSRTTTAGKKRSNSINIPPKPAEPSIPVETSLQAEKEKTASGKFRRTKLVIFSLLPAVVLFGLIESSAQLYWWHLKKQALQSVNENGKKVLRNDAINFLKIPDPILGYRMAPNLNKGNVVTTSQGFNQHEPVSVKRAPGSIRIMAVGESTTMGHHVDTGNYPSYLRTLVGTYSQGYSGGTEVINAGVAGWVSDQEALWAENELKLYMPDIVIIYAGWNDLQSYDPLAGPTRVSYFEQAYGTSPKFVFTQRLKSVTLAQSYFASRLRPRKIAHDKSKDVETLSLPPINEWWRQNKAETVGDLVAGPQAGITVKRIVLGDKSYLWHSTPDGVPLKGTYTASVFLKGSGSLNIKVNGRSSPWPTYKVFPVALAEAWTRYSFPFEKPDDSMAIQFSLMNYTGKEDTISAWGALINEGVNPAEYRYATNVDETYRFFLKNIDRIVTAFRSKNPKVSIVICTLAGRWPLSTEDDYLSKSGHIWWMKTHDFTQEQAASFLKPFNEMVRRLAQRKGLFLIDVEKYFDNLDRMTLMGDFAHMTDEGYKLMAEIIYNELVKAGKINGKPCDEVPALLAKYTRK